MYILSLFPGPATRYKMGEEILQCPQFVKDVNEINKIASSVVQLCINEAKTGMLKLPVTDKSRANAYTGIIIPAEKIPQPTFPLSSDAFYIRPLIQKTFTNMVLKNRLLPSLNLLHKEIGSTALTMACMRDLGYEWQKLPNNNHAFIVEKPNFIQAKHRYLRKIQQYRSDKRDIVYVIRITGQTINGRQPQLFEQHRNLLLEQNKVVYSAFSPQYGLLHETVGSLSDGTEGSKGFQDWVFKQVVPIVPENSILVIPKLVGLEKEHKDIINSLSTRKDMMACLEKNHIPYDKFMHKSHLFDLVTKHELNKEPRSQLEIKLEAKDIDYLFRPVWMSDFCYSYELFNGISNINEKLVELVTSDALSLAGNFFCNILSGLEKTYWKITEEKLATKEEDCLKDDALVEDILDQVIAMAMDEEILDTDIISNELDLYESSDEK